MKMCPRIKTTVAAFLLTVLLAAYAGQKVHIYLEDHAHFKAFCGALVPDNHARESVVERCIIDDFPFYSYLDMQLPGHMEDVAALGVLRPVATRGKSVFRVAYVSLRAPPVS